MQRRTNRVLSMVARVCIGAVVWALVGSTGFAQGWPAPNPDWANAPAGGGIAILPLLCWWLQVVGWAMAGDWITRDSAKLGLRPNLWGALAAFPFVAAALIGLLIPSAIAGQVIMALSWLVPALVYSSQHNAKVGKSEKVLTGGHMRRLLPGSSGSSASRWRPRSSRSKYSPRSPSRRSAANRPKTTTGGWSGL